MNNQCEYFDGECPRESEHTIENCPTRCIRIVGHAEIPLLDKPTKHLWMEWPDAGKPTYHWFD